MSNPADEVRVETKVLENGLVGMAVFRGAENLGEKMMTQDDVASLAAHFLNAATAAQKTSHSLPGGAGHTVHPTGISLAQTTEGQTVMVLWFGQGGVSFPLDPAMAKELFKAVSETHSPIKKH